MTNQEKQDWEKEFEDGKCSGQSCRHEISEDHAVYTKNEIRQEINKAREEERERVLGIAERMKRDCGHDSHSHCMEEQCWIHEEDGYNQALSDLIAKLKEE